MYPLLQLIVFWFAVVLFCYGFGASRCVFEGKIWGLQIVASKKQKSLIKIARICKIIGVILALVFLMPAIRALFGFGSFLITIFVYGIILYLTFFIAFGIGGNAAAKIVYDDSDKNALLLEKIFEIFSNVEGAIEDAEYVGFDSYGFYFADEKNYCYYSVMYSQFELGNLYLQDEIDLIRLYFCQKYGRRFSLNISGRTIGDVNLIGAGEHTHPYSFYKNKKGRDKR
ncbi:MAG: hypothetical protein IKT34_02360 [Clostridia bacterium]|nr:hypothetical protein [Clostridia bacterium]